MVQVVLFTACAAYSIIVISLLLKLFSPPKGRNTHTPSVSVIVAAHNEEQNIGKCIKHLVSQTYKPELLEIILVNDRSTDSTEKIISDWARRYPLIRKIDIKYPAKNIGPKKNALAHGIAAATGDILFFTDADCRPPDRWIEKTMPHFENKVGLVAGFAPLAGHENNLFHRIIELDTVITAGVAAAGITKQKPITCNGRNLAYRKKVYDQVQGFATISRPLAGDDDLFLHLVATRTNWECRYSWSSETFVGSSAPRTLKNYFAQRRRHISTSMYYPLNTKLGYAVYHAGNIIIFFFLFYSIASGSFIASASFVFLVKCVIDFLFIKKTTTTFSKQHLLKYFLFWEFFTVLSNALIGPLGFLRKVTWK